MRRFFRRRRRISFIQSIIAGAILCALLVFIKDIDLSNLSVQNVIQSFSTTHAEVAGENEYDMSVHIMDLGKADSIYIQCKDKNILIDAGDKEIHNRVLEYLNKRSIPNFDLVVVTHPHRDHIGGMEDVINKFSISKFIMPQLKDGVMSTTTTYKNMLLAIEKKNISPQLPKPGESFNIGDMKVEILAPNKVYDDVNNYSVVTKITYGNDSFLFTGDAETLSEHDMISQGFDLQADVLKVGHHGSKTSTSQEFLDAVKPDYAVISVGPDKNNLPKPQIINRLAKNNIKTYRTDFSGTVVFRTNGNGINVFTEKNKDKAG